MVSSNVRGRGRVRGRVFTGHASNHSANNSNFVPKVEATLNSSDPNLNDICENKQPLSGSKAKAVDKTSTTAPVVSDNQNLQKLESFNNKGQNNRYMKSSDHSKDNVSGNVALNAMDKGRRQHRGSSKQEFYSNQINTGSSRGNRQRVKRANKSRSLGYKDNSELMNQNADGYVKVQIPDKNCVKKKQNNQNEQKRSFRVRGMKRREQKLQNAPSLQGTSGACASSVETATKSICDYDKTVESQIHNLERDINNVSIVSNKILVEQNKSRNRNYEDKHRFGRGQHNRPKKNHWKGSQKNNLDVNAAKVPVVESISDTPMTRGDECVVAASSPEPAVELHEELDTSNLKTYIENTSHSLSSLNCQSLDSNEISLVVQPESSHDNTSSSYNDSISDGKKNIWRPRNLDSSLCQLDHVRRQIKALLNKLTVEKFTVVTEKLAQLDCLRGESQLQELVNQLLDKAVTEPDFSEMYADLCQVLKWRSPNLNADRKSQQPIFSRVLLIRCEEEFKKMPRTMLLTDEEKLGMDEDEIASVIYKRKTRVLGIVRLIGELFVRRMFPLKSLNELVFDLVMPDEPEEHSIECLCQLINTTGYYLDSNAKSKMVLDQWFGRLCELQKQHYVSTRLKCLIQDVLELRQHNWVKKVHKERAKALSDIQRDLANEDALGGSVHAAQYGSVIVVGERSNMVTNKEYKRYMLQQEKFYFANVASSCAKSNIPQ